MKKIAIVIILAAMMAGAASAQTKRKSKPKPKPVNYLLQGSIAVSKYEYRMFLIGRDGGQVWGRFEARGGGNNDIYCYIVDPDGYQNLQNGNQAQTYYNSGRVTVGNINVRLDPGKYYLVFYNESLFYNKTVYGEIKYIGAGG